MGNTCCGGSRRSSQDRVQKWATTGMVGLRDMNLQQFPDELAGIAQAVKVLDASHNAIKCLPSYIDTFQILQRLLLPSNRLDELPAAACNLSSVRILVLDANLLTTLPSELSNMAGLENLSVAGNALEYLPDSIGKLKSLRILNLSKNRLRALPKELGDCDSLEEVNASDNQLSTIPATLSNLQKLKKLLLDNNKITAVPAALLLYCNALQTLSMHDNPITIEVLMATEGYKEFEERRRTKFDKAIASGVLLGSKGLDEGVDRKLLES